VTLALLVVAAVLAVNAPRARSALRPDGALGVALLGSAGALAVLVPLAALAGALARAVHVSAPTARMGAGAALAVVGAAEALLPLPRPEPGLAGWSAALVPMAFPVLLTPAVGLVALTGSLDRGAPVAIAALTGALATVPLVAAVLRPGTSPLADRTSAALARVLAVGLVAVGIALVLDGVFDV
jgi:small neutral amino acid transporter SnatA (MarC family)